MSRQEDFIDEGIAYRMEHGKPMCIAGSNLADVERDLNRVFPFEAGAEYGYQYATKNLWHDAQGDIVPEYDREVIVIGRDGKIFYGHRPNPKEVTMVEGKPYHAKTYDKNGWNWPDIALWLDVEIPHDVIDYITDKWFKEHEQRRNNK